MNPTPILRVARPSDDPAALLPFYVTGLGLQLLFQFADHDGFDGVIIGGPQARYHFEFTRKHGHHAGRAPTQDHLAVFYFPEHTAWRAAIARMQNAGFPPVASFNPYWDRKGATFEDPDGYRIVLQNTAWTA